MHIELVDQLRCIRDHDESALVTIIDRQEGRYIADGSLGCPVCSAHYPIAGFIADFRDHPRPRDTAGDAGGAMDDDAILRTAAMLDARVAGARYVLVGEWGRLAQGLALSYDVHCVVVNPPASVLPAEGISIVLADARLPLARESMQGAALDAVATASPRLFAGALAAVRGGGRIVTPAGTPVDSGARPVAQDAQWRVAERIVPDTTPIALGRARRSL